MKKLQLDLDRLVVESFDAEPVRADRKGTVRGQEWTWESCRYPCTDWDSCGGTCDYASCAC
jgi:hypothetical protein